MKRMAGRQFEGINRVTYLINPDGAIHKVYPKVVPRGHAQQVLADWVDDS